MLTRYDDHEHPEIFPYSDLTKAYDRAIELAKQRFGGYISWHYKLNTEFGPPGVHWVYIDLEKVKNIPFARINIC